jgi:hypothetical protein
MASLMRQIAICIRRYNDEELQILAEILEEREMYEYARRLRSTNLFVVYAALTRVLDGHRVRKAQGRTDKAQSADAWLLPPWQENRTRWNKRFHRWGGLMSPQPSKGSKVERYSFAVNATLALGNTQYPGTPHAHRREHTPTCPRRIAILHKVLNPLPACNCGYE